MLKLNKLEIASFRKKKYSNLKVTKNDDDDEKTASDINGIPMLFLFYFK